MINIIVIPTLALGLWREARGEGFDGMRAVAHVFRNRVRAGWHDGDWYTNLISKNELSSMTVLCDPQTICWPSTEDELFKHAYRIAYKVINDDDPEDITKGAVFYRNPKTATSVWFQRNVVESGKYFKSAAIGNHVFWAPVKE